MLQHGKLIWLATEVIQKLVDQRIVQLTAGNQGWFHNGRTVLVTREAWGQKLAVIDGFGESGEQRTVTKKVRTHGDDHVYWHLRLLGLRRGQQQVHEGVRVIDVLRLFPITEDLFKLVNDQQQIGIFR